MSLTISGLFVMILNYFFEGAGIEVGSEALTNFVQVMVFFGSAFMIYWGRYRKGDLTLVGSRK